MKLHTKKLQIDTKSAAAA